MIVSLETLKTIKELSNYTIDELTMMQDSIESLIRSYTHNNFQNRMIRNLLPSSDRKLIGQIDFLEVGDTIEINNSINKGLYVVEAIIDGYIQVDKNLYDCDSNLVTKIEYPKVIQQGVINLMKFDATTRSKQGIQSETISRHSVTYFNQDGENSIMGYPKSLLGFLRPFMKARF